MRTSRFGLALALLAVTAVTVSADVRYVDANRTGGGDTGVDWDNAWTNLQTALAGASSGDDLWIAKGTYYPGSARTDTFAMKSGVNLYGGFTNGMTSLDQRDWLEHPAILSGDIDKNGILDANNSYHVVTVAGTLSPMPVLDGVQIWHGYANGVSPDSLGAGLYCLVSNFKIYNCVFGANYGSGNGSAIHVDNGKNDTLISNCLFTMQTGLYVIFLHTTQRSTLQNTIFLENDCTASLYSYQGGTAGNTASNCTWETAGTRFIKD